VTAVLDQVAESGHTVAVHDFEVLVLGSGPGGQKAAIAAAKLGRRVAIVERRNMMARMCIKTGTITADKIIATGPRPARPATVELVGREARTDV
jgi:flavin-dependent dehydrogenase